MLNLLRAELEREFDVEGIQRVGTHYLGLDPHSLLGTTPAEVAHALVEQCALLDSLEALADVVAMERPSSARRLSGILREGFRAAEAVHAGVTLGRYTLYAVLGIGPDSTVFRARDGERVVRLRLMRQCAPRDRYRVNRYLTAARVAAEVSEKWLPMGGWAGPAGDRMVVVHDLFDGEPLSARPPEPMRIREAWPIVRRVLTALDALHKRGLTHGALHADNILLGRGDEAPPVVVLDAGAHYLRSGHFAGGYTTGRVNPVAAAWAAPEQLLGHLPTPRSDVYSVAMLLYALVAGRLPLGADTPHLLRRRLSSDPDPLGFLAPHGSVSDELEEIVLRLVDADPMRRPPDAAAVLELLAAVVSSASATPSTVPDIDTDAELELLLADPENETRAAVLEAAIERGANPRRVADAFVLAAEQLPADGDSRESRRRLLVRAGAIYENLVGDPRASERAYRAVLEQDRSAEGAWAALERTYRRSGDFAKLAELLLDRRDSLQDHAERAQVLVRLARVLSRDVGDEAQAIVALAEAVAEDPFNDTHANALEALAQGDRGAWRGALEALGNAANAETDPERRCRLFVRLGQWHEREVGRADLALRSYQNAVRADPANEFALERVAEIYRRAQLWSELAQALLARASVTAAPALARDLRAEAAGVLLEHAGAVSAARETLDQVLSEEPSHPQAGRLLCRLLLAEGQPREWARVMEQRIDVAAGPERRDLLAELARGQLEQLKELDAAIVSWELVLAENPTDIEAMRALESAYVEAGRPAKAVEVLEAELAIALTPRQRVSLLERIAKISERDLLDDSAAADALERLVAVDADHEGALPALAAVYQRLRRWEALAHTLERRAEHAHSPAERIEALLALGKLAGDELEDPARALSAFDAVLAIEPSHRGALDAAVALRAEQGDVERAADALDQLAKQEAEAGARADAWVRAADARRRQGDADGALERYRHALDAAGGHTCAVCRMATLLVEQGEVPAAIAALEHALPRAEHGHDRAEIGAVLARILLDQRNDPGRAGAAVTVALEHDPTSPAVHFVAAELERRVGNHDRAADHLEKAALHLDRFTPADQIRLLSQQADSLARADRLDDARRRLSLLVERFGSRRDAMELGAELAYRIEESGPALAMVDKLISAHESQLPIDALAMASFRRGELLRRLGRHADAVVALERAVSVDRQHTDALRSLVAIHRESKRTEALRSAIDRLLERLSPAEHAEVMVELGDVAAEALEDRELAARIYLAVLAARPDDRKMLLRLVRLHSDAEDWGPLIDVILKLAELSSDRNEKARYVQMAARLCDKELGDPSRAVELYDAALKLDPGSEENVSRALALHSKLGDTAVVRQILEQQIARASATQDRERAYRLATSLADLDLGELQVDDAIAINEAALQLVAQDPERENVLSDLYLTDAKRYLHRAAALQRRIIERDPSRPEPYRRLRQLGLAAQRIDAAFCACQALAVLKSANADEEAFFNDHRRGTLMQSAARVGEAEWANLLVHPDANPTLTGLLLQIHPVVTSRSRGVSLGELGLDERRALDPARAEGTLVQAFRRASEVLRTPMPLLFENPEQKVAVVLGQGARPHVLLSSSAAHKPFTERKAAFIAASSSVLLRPGYLLRVLLSQAELKAWVLGTIRLVVPKFTVSAELEESVLATHKQLDRHLPDAIKKRIGELLDAMLKAGGQADLTRWVAGVDQTADRAGLLFCNDLATTLGVIRASGDSALSLGAAERANSLLRYSVSGEYLRLRNALALSVDKLEQEELEASDIAELG